MSLMRSHQQAVREAMQTPAAEVIGTGAVVLGTMSTGLVGAQQLATMLENSLTEDLRILHELTSIERKVEHKRDVLLPKYREYMPQLMEAGQPHPLIGNYLVWCLDAGCIEEALTFADWCMLHNQPMPERFRASVPLFCASQVLQWAEREYNAGRSFEPYLTETLARIEGTIPDLPRWDVDDATCAGFHRLLGLQAEKDDRLADAEAALTRALDLGAKVKTALDGVRKRMARAGSTDDPATV